jgi:hypothetical protein
MATTFVGDAAGTRRLADIEWQLTAYRNGDEPPIAVPDDEVHVLRFDGQGLFSTSGCNDSAGLATIGATTIDALVEEQTLVGCPEPVALLDGITIPDSGATWTFVGDSLEIDHGGFRSTYQVREPPFPGLAGDGWQVLLEQVGDGSGPQYQLAWAPHPGGVSGVLNARAEAGLPWDSQSFAVEPSAELPMEPMAEDGVVGEVLVLFGAAAEDTTRAAHVSEDGTETDLALVDLDATHRMFLGTVEPLATGFVAQWDATGALITTSQRVPRA